MIPAQVKTAAPAAVRWAMWSKRRAQATAAGIVLAVGSLVWLAGVALPDEPADQAPAAATEETAEEPQLGMFGTTTPSTSPESAEEPLTVPEGAPTEGPEARRAVRDTTTAFFAAWVAADREVPGWSQDLAPHADGAVVAMVYGSAAADDPAEVPEVSVESVTAFNALAYAEFPDGRTLDVSLAPSLDGWRVSGLTAGHGDHDGHAH